MVTLEASATDHCAPDQPDICGFVPAPKADSGTPLATDAPLATLSLRLKEAGVPAEISQDAGAYLCNYSYRHALACVGTRRLRPKVLFVHLPALEGTALAKETAASIMLKEAMGALTLIASELVS